MNKSYFLLFVGVLVMAAGFALNFSRQYLAAYEQYLSSNLQASLVNIKLKEISSIDAGERAKEERVSLLFTGDIMLSRGVEHQIEINGNSKYPFLRVADILKENDIVFGNLEGPISDTGSNEGSEYSFRANLNVVSGLKYAGFNVLNLANNHIWDWGKAALTETMDVLDNNGISWVGAGRNEVEANSPLIIKIGRTDAAAKIAFLGYTSLYPRSRQAKGSGLGISDPDLAKAEEIIKEIKASNLADIVVVSFHWGEEYQKQENNYQKETAHALIDAGADLVVGHHPHAIQEVEQYKGKFIAYSLGNFVFDQNFSEDTNSGLVLKVVVDHKNIAEVNPINIKINNTFQPEIL